MKPAMAEQRRFLTIQECANEARVSPSSMRHWLRVDKLKSYRLCAGGSSSAANSIVF